RSPGAFGGGTAPRAGGLGAGLCPARPVTGRRFSEATPSGAGETLKIVSSHEVMLPQLLRRDTAEHPGQCVPHCSIDRGRVITGREETLSHFLDVRFAAHRVTSQSTKGKPGRTTFYPAGPAAASLWHTARRAPGRARHSHCSGP